MSETIKIGNKTYNLLTLTYEWLRMTPKAFKEKHGFDFEPPEEILHEIREVTKEKLKQRK